MISDIVGVIMHEIESHQILSIRYLQINILCSILILFTKQKFLLCCVFTISESAISWHLWIKISLNLTYKIFIKLMLSQLCFCSHNAARVMLFFAVKSITVIEHKLSKNYV